MQIFTFTCLVTNQVIEILAVNLEAARYKLQNG